METDREQSNLKQKEDLTTKIIVLLAALTKKNLQYLLTMIQEAEATQEMEALQTMLKLILLQAQYRLKKEKQDTQLFSLKTIPEKISL